jgi:hypothetical protein
MRVGQIISALVIVLGVGSTAKAEPICGGAMALRVNDPGLSFLVEEIRPMVPDTIDVPAITKVVVDWPMTEDDATVQTQPMIVALNLKDLQLKMNGDALRLVAKADVSTDGPVTVLNPYASFGQADCHANIQVQDLVVDLSMRVSIQGTKVAAVVTKAYITLDNDNSIIARRDRQGAGSSADGQQADRDHQYQP